MKSMKKLGALLLAVVLVAALCVPALATADPVTYAKPASTDTATISVTGVETDATVNAYKIIEAVYSADGLLGYQWTSAAATALSVTQDAFDAATMPTVAQIYTLAAAASSLTPTTMTEDSATEGKYAASVAAGSYVVLVTGTAATVYNPIVLSAAYLTTGTDDNGNTASGTLNKLQESELAIQNNVTKLELFDDTGAVKATPINVDKTEGDVATDVTVNGQHYSIGDTVYFKIATNMPSYSDAYTTDSLVFNVSDTLSTGMELDTTSIAVTVGGTTAAAETAYTLDPAATKSAFTVKFVPSFIKANGGKDVVVTYSAVITEKANLNATFGYNEAKVTLTNDPTGTTTGLTDVVYVYTFAIETEVIKEAAGTTPTALAGAQFTLFTDAACKTPVASKDTDHPITNPVTTGSDGLIKFAGLDAGTYYLKETKAPDGYTLNSNIYKVDIAATLESTEGYLTDYTITITNTAKTSETATFKWIVTYKMTDGVLDRDASGKVIVDKVTLDEEGDPTTITNPFEILDTPLSELPTTGGIGTYLFTVIGVVVMAAAVGFFMINRRKQNG